MKHATLVGAVFAVVAFAQLGVSAVAGAAVPHYTGCLTDKGAIIGLQAGETPLFACGDKATQIQLSGGDITKVDAGTGLEGGGANGDVALDVAPTSAAAELRDGSAREVERRGVVVREPLQQHLQWERLRAVEPVVFVGQARERHQLHRHAQLRERSHVQRERLRAVEPVV